MEKHFVGWKKSRNGGKKGTEMKGRKNEDMWNLHENLKCRKLTSYIKT